MKKKCNALNTHKKIGRFKGIRATAKTEIKIKLDETCYQIISRIKSDVWSHGAMCGPRNVYTNPPLLLLLYRRHNHCTSEAITDQPAAVVIQMLSIRPQIRSPATGLAKLGGRCILD